MSRVSDELNSQLTKLSVTHMNCKQAQHGLPNSDSQVSATLRLGVFHMSKMPPVPPNNQSNKGFENSHPEPQVAHDLKDHKHHNSSEQGETANIEQNTTNKGFFRGRRVK